MEILEDLAHLFSFAIARTAKQQAAYAITPYARWPYTTAMQSSPAAAAAAAASLGLLLPVWAQTQVKSGACVSPGLWLPGVRQTAITTNRAGALRSFVMPCGPPPWRLLFHGIHSKPPPPVACPHSCSGDFSADMCG